MGHAVLLVEHQPLVSAGLKTLIEGEADLEVGAVVKDRQSALETLRNRPMNLVAIELATGRLDLVSDLHRRYPNLPILIVTEDSQPLLAERAMRAGATACVDKQQSTEAVLATIRVALQGGERAAYTTEKLLLNRQLAAPQLPGLETVSDRELEVFRLLGAGLTTIRIAEELFLSPKTVHTYRSRLRDKLHLESSDQLLLTAVRWTRAQETQPPNPRQRSRPPKPTSQAVHCLLSPLLSERVLLERKTLILGRGAGCDVQVKSASVSREHVRLRWDETGFVVTDLDTTNGTLLNGHPVTGPCWLQDRDRLDLGHVEVWYFASVPDDLVEEDEKTRPMSKVGAEA